MGAIFSQGDRKGEGRFMPYVLSLMLLIDLFMRPDIDEDTLIRFFEIKNNPQVEFHREAP